MGGSGDLHSMNPSPTDVAPAPQHVDESNGRTARTPKSAPTTVMSPTDGRPPQTMMSPTDGRPQIDTDVVGGDLLLVDGSIVDTCVQSCANGRPASATVRRDLPGEQNVFLLALDSLVWVFSVLGLVAFCYHLCCCCSGRGDSEEQSEARPRGDAIQFRSTAAEAPAAEKHMNGHFRTTRRRNTM